eukprot:TRINITY_DN13635_c0_g1_i1.p1 TRINITY_DN13635_c0_g1~~TRINITY_DN13635_c0_g1_i1.p1  ORF type:complete len:114 (+),score=12.45 TRINITY_DN13635_c0_g1_i1:40-381(+)
MELSYVNDFLARNLPQNLTPDHVLLSFAFLGCIYIGYVVSSFIFQSPPPPSNNDEITAESKYLPDFSIDEIEAIKGTPKEPQFRRMLENHDKRSESTRLNSSHIPLSRMPSSA